MATSPSNLLLSLTPGQKKAVTSSSKRVMIIAGAGTGKTTVLTTRIAWLIEQGIKPENILALTFTEKAANEMEERVDRLTKYGIFGTTISTFHALGQRLLQEFGNYVNMDDQTHVMTEIEQILFVRERLMHFPLQELRPLSHPTFAIKPMLAFFARLKDELITPDKLATALSPDQLEHGEMSELLKSYRYYQQLLKDQNVLDFGELLLRLHTLLLTHPDVTARLQKRYTYILVDEYQDTNRAQVEIVKLLTADQTYLTVVGDDDQSIYRFRGATIGQMEQFKHDYAKCEIIILTNNFRSNQVILDSSYRLIQHNNPHRLESQIGISKKLSAQSQKAKKENIPVYIFETELDEAEWVIQQISDHLKDGVALEDHCILVRTNAQSRIFRQLMTEMNLPYTTKVENSLADDPLIKQLLYFFATILNPHDFLSLFFLATSPIYKLSGAELIPLMAEAKSSHLPLATLIEQDPKINQTAAVLLEDIKWGRQFVTDHLTSELIHEWYNKRQIFDGALEIFLGDPVKVADSLTRFDQTMRQFEAATTNNSFFHFMENRELILAENATADDPLPGGGVRLLTAHLAKGLEFPVVFITNLAEGRFPSIERAQGFTLPPELSTADDEGEHLREERRLMYVALTRAKSEVFLTLAKRYGQGTRERKTSRFIAELSPVEEHKIPHAQKLKQATQRSNLLSFTHYNKTQSLTPHSLQDYLDCPLRYRFAHLDHIPPPEEPNLSIGRALHEVFAFYLNQRSQSPVQLDDLLKQFKSRWVNRGFESKELAQARLDEALSQVDHFFNTFEKFDLPKDVERSFAVKVGDVNLTGRMDAVYASLPEISPNSTVILDFKTSDGIKDQSDADRRVKESLQLVLYALAWQKEFNYIPSVALYFPSQNLFAKKIPSTAQIENAGAKIGSAIEQINKKADFTATPSLYVCGYCPFRHFCPESMARS